MMMTVMMTMMSDGYEDPYLYVFHIRFKSPVRPDWRCRGCVVITTMVIIGDDNGDDEIGDAEGA